jgi:hypothetical protein
MRPASVRSTSSPFVKQKRKAGSKPIEIPYDQMEESFNHRLESDLNIESLQRLRRELQAAEDRLGPTASKTKKLRREINRQLEQGLYLQGTWCRGCLRVLHLCRCPNLAKITTPNKAKLTKQQQREAAATHIVHRILQEVKGQRLTGKEERRLRREAKAAALLNKEEA